MTEALVEFTRDGKTYRTKLTPERHATIVETFRKGGTPRMVAGKARVAEDTLLRWLRNGESDWKAWDEGNADEQTIFAQLFIDARDAIADRDLSWLDEVKSGEKTWQRFAWLLERTAPTEFAVTPAALTKRLEIRDGEGRVLKIEGGSDPLDTLRVLQEAGVRVPAPGGAEDKPAAPRGALPAAREVLAEPAEGEPSADGVPAD